MDDCWNLCVVYVLQTSMDINRQLILNPCESMQSLFYCVLWLDSVILHAKISLMHEKLVKKSDCSVRKSLLWVLDTRASTDHSYLRHLFCTPPSSHPYVRAWIDLEMMYQLIRLFRIIGHGEVVTRILPKRSIQFGEGRL